MNPVITDQDTGRLLWRVTDCAEHCGIKPTTFRTHVCDGRAPQPVAHLGKSPLWDAEQVKTWHTNRPGSPIPGAPGKQAPR